MTDCVVIGGGLIGMLSACMLREAGAEVLLLERTGLGREASWAGGGILSPLHPWRYPEPVTQLARYGQAHYRAFAGALLEETGIDPEWTPSGLLILDMQKERDAALDWGRAHEAHIEAVDAPGIHALEPALAEPGEPGLWMPDIAQMRNPRLMKALRERLDRRGIAYREHSPVHRLVLDGDRITGVETDEGQIGAATVLVAGGAWSAGLLAPATTAPEVYPVRGQMILFQGPPSLMRRIVLKGNRYLIPRRDGRIVTGSTLEYVGFEKATTREALEQLRREAIDLVPDLARASIEHHWAGLRPGSPSSVPVIGAHPQIEGLFLNTGHFRNGVVLGLGSARLITDLIKGEKSEIQPKNYAFDAKRSKLPINGR